MDIEKNTENKESIKKEDLNKEDTKNAIIGWITIIFFIWIFGGFSNNDTKMSSTLPSTSAINKETSSTSNTKEAINTCGKIFEAFETAFNSDKYFKTNLTLLKLKATKVEVEYETDNIVSCAIFIKNNGDTTVTEIKGNLYYWEEDAFESSRVWLHDIIKPGETIKYKSSYIPKNIKKAEIRDSNGDNIFEYNYSINPYK